MIQQESDVASSSGRSHVSSVGFRPVTHVIFDVDGLLLDTETIYTTVTQTIIDEYRPGKVYTFEIKAPLMGFQKEDLAKKIVEIFDLPMTWQEFDEIAHRELNKSFRNCNLMPGAERLVKHLKSHNIPIAVATSSASQSIEVKTTNHRKLFELFDHIVMGSTDPEVKRGKPMPDIFLVAAGRFKNPPKVEDCLVFEDSPNGVAAAVAAGMQVVMVPDPNAADELKRDATQVIPSLLHFKPEDFGLPRFM